jgi:hypothetical protein
VSDSPSEVARKSSMSAPSSLDASEASSKPSKKNDTETCKMCES